MCWVYRIIRYSCKSQILQLLPREEEVSGKMKLLIYIINTIRFISKLIIIKTEQVIYANRKELTAQNQHLNRSWIWITHHNVWTYSRFCKRKNISSFRTFKMKKYNNFSNYKSNKSSQVKKTLSSLWISFKGNKEQTKKESLLLTSISKSNFKI